MTRGSKYFGIDPALVQTLENDVAHGLDDGPLWVELGQVAARPARLLVHLQHLCRRPWLTKGGGGGLKTIQCRNAEITKLQLFFQSDSGSKFIGKFHLNRVREDTIEISED